MEKKIKKVLRAAKKEKYVTSVGGGRGVKAKIMDYKSSVYGSENHTCAPHEQRTSAARIPRGSLRPAPGKIPECFPSLWEPERQRERERGSGPGQLGN